MMPMDEIRIDNLEVYAYHGVYATENEKGQPFFVNAVLYTDTYKAGNSDELADSTNYGEVCHLITDVMQECTYQLIEKVAESVAREILLTYPLVRAVDVEIRKPQAPIGLPFESVSVKIHRQWHKAYIALGSNMGDKQLHVQQAVGELDGIEGIRVGKCSDFLITRPYGNVEQEDFINGALEIETIYKPQVLLEHLHRIEQAHNRERLIHWGPRTLDLDIIFYDDVIMDTADLVIPHADMCNRDFVLKPLAQIAPYYRHPVLQLTVEQLLKNLLQK